MKVIISGATGFIGAAVLEHLLASPSITSVVALSRRELPTKNTKLQTIIVKDFLHYGPDVRDQLAGAEACIWALGSATAGRDVHHDLTFAATKAFSESLLPKLDAGKEFRFVYTSGALVARDQNASPWILGGLRKLRGEIESKVVELETLDAGSSWKSYVVRPAMVTIGEPMLKFLLSGYYIPKGELAATMVDLAVNGGDHQTWENAELRQRGRALLERM